MRQSPDEKEDDRSLEANLRCTSLMSGLFSDKTEKV